MEYDSLIGMMQTAWRMNLQLNEQHSWIYDFSTKFTALGQLLNSPEKPNIFQLFDTYLSSGWWNRLLFRNFLQLQGEASSWFLNMENLAKTLKKQGFFSQHDLTSFAYPGHLFDLFKKLHEKDFLTPEIQNLAANHPNHEKLRNAYVILNMHHTSICTIGNFTLLARHPQPDLLCDGFGTLNHAKILTPENQNLLVTHANPYFLAEVFAQLKYARIFTPINRDILVAHPNPESLAYVFSYLNRPGILTQRNFDALMQANHAHLLTIEARQNVWARIPQERLTEANFNRLLTAATHATPTQEITRVYNQIMGIEPLNRTPTVVNLNPDQSTHTASVHQTVSQSATNLLTSYGSHLDLETTIANIKKYVQGLNNSPKNAAAKRCIERITAVHYTFSDRTSGLSIRQLLALAWLAIHDSSKCSASLNDGLALLIDGLYEIQRGYNLDEHGEDNGRQDSPICSAGTFNKLIEKLNGVHQDVAVYYITHEGALSKFPKLVQSHAKAYLSRLAEPKDSILSAIEKAGNIAPIWDAIKDTVIAELWDEFKAAYGNNRLDTRFTSLIEYWADVEVDVAEFCAHNEAMYQQIQASSRSTLQSSHSLWAERHTSSETQHEFDSRYGLILP